MNPYLFTKSVNELAAAAGVSPSTAARWNSGKRVSRSSRWILELVVAGRIIPKRSWHGWAFAGADLHSPDGYQYTAAQLGDRGYEVALLRSLLQDLQGQIRTFESLFGIRAAQLEALRPATRLTIRSLIGGLLEQTQSQREQVALNGL